jgi:hypothetical protein
MGKNTAARRRRKGGEAERNEHLPYPPILPSSSNGKPKLYWQREQEKDEVMTVGLGNAEHVCMCGVC